MFALVLFVDVNAVFYVVGVTVGLLGGILIGISIRPSGPKPPTPGV